MLQRITITRKLRADGVEVYRVDREGEVGWLDGLALLEAAKFDHLDYCNDTGPYAPDADG